MHSPLRILGWRGRFFVLASDSRYMAFFIRQIQQRGVAILCIRRWRDGRGNLQSISDKAVFSYLLRPFSLAGESIAHDFFIF